jgi:hypothetical protein
MPTRYRTAPWRPHAGWAAIWDSMYKALESKAARILQPAGFYERHDLEIPTALEGRELIGEEKAAIQAIATALTVAADCAHKTSPGVIAAWLRELAKKPQLFRSRDLPPEVHWEIVLNYRREFERPGMHMHDMVWGRRWANFSTTARRPTEFNISRAARLAEKNLRQPRGRPRNHCNWILAEHLGRTFYSVGGRIVRRQVAQAKVGGGLRYVEDGPFYCFLEEVIDPLVQYLKQHALPSVSIDTIERIASEHYT